MIWNKTRQSGFTLVETMVAMALLSVAITLGMNFISGATKARRTRTTQSMQRYIAIQVTQHITASLAFYPHINHPFTKKIVYVGCMTKEGILIGNKYYFHSLSAFTFKDKNPTGFCPAVTSAYEVRFYWTETTAKPDEVKINLLTLETGTTRSLAVHNFYIFAK
jgi:prepilin-type N-terminal cleavage/methylation domain-containing protein